MNDWTARVPCLGQPELMTAATTPDLVREAVAVCQGCPFTDECLDLLASAGPPANSETDGVVAAGLTGDALAAALRRRAPRPVRVRPWRHGTPAGARRHYRAGEKPCDACRVAEAVRVRPDAAFRVSPGMRRAS